VDGSIIEDSAVPDDVDRNDSSVLDAFFDIEDATVIDAGIDDTGVPPDSETCGEFCVDAGLLDAGNEDAAQVDAGRVDTDECGIDNGGCDPLTTCIDTPDSRTCGPCPSGYSGSGDTTCTDIDECTMNHGDCDPRVTCVNAPGTHSCGPCPTGYAGTGVAGCSYLHLYPPQAYIKASNTGSGDLFGRAIALSADGSTLAVGALAEDSASTGIGGNQTSNTLSSSGAVYVFRRDSSGTWTQEAYIKASNPGTSDEFGSALALSADGSTLAVGAHFEDSSASGPNGDQSSNAAINSGAVYLFRRDTDGTWMQEAYLKASNSDASDEFGLSLALSGDGAALVVGAPREDSAARGIDGDQAGNTAVDAGAVYVFRRSAGTWTQEAYVKASNADAGDLFGGSVALSEDGATLAVGATNEDSASRGVDSPQSSNTASNSGAVYVFVRSIAGAWSQEAYVKASNADSTDMFGSSVALAADGATLAVGAPFEDSATRGVGGDEANSSASNAGAVYVFERDASRWSQEIYVKASNTDIGDQFGSSVAISADGQTLVVATNFEDSIAVGVGGLEGSDSAADSGAAYVFARSTVGVWTQQTYVKATNTAGEDYFGDSVAISWDGSTLVVGAPQEDSSSVGVGGVQTNNSTTNSGAVYVYR
jgi:hypothetical protein